MSRATPLLGAVVAGLAAWLVGLVAGPFAPLLAGLVAGLLAPTPRRAFLYPALGVFAAWAIWFAASAATSPILPLGRILASVMGLPALGGAMLPLLACLLAGLVAGLAAAGLQAMVHKA